MSTTPTAHYNADTGNVTVPFLLDAAQYRSARVRDYVRAAADKVAAEHERTITFPVKSHAQPVRMTPSPQAAGSYETATMATATHYLWTGVWLTVPAVAPAPEKPARNRKKAAA